MRSAAIARPAKGGAPVAFADVTLAVPSSTEGQKLVSKLRVRCSDDGATITVTSADRESPRTFVVFEEDRRELKGACVRWAGSQFLEYSNGFIDVTTMKYAPVFPSDEERSRIEYDRSFERAVRVDRAKLQIGIVTVPR